ncbi:MAG: hypothetical protein F4X60_15920 [Gemmatimonadetes bacterium]|nr:hypothetical protein [Gemmatimonadota bacterium]MYC00021.1 hypothetical protein [Gemmatimonadota bacterium]
MARRISPSQLRSKLRQLDAKNKKAINDYNRKVREYNRKVRRAVDDYNRTARAHNSRVRANRRRLQNELARLNSRNSHSHIRSSSQNLYRSFTRVETRFGTSTATDRESRFLDSSEREVANSLALVNALEGNATADWGIEHSELQDTKIDGELRSISLDLARRWRGALFALDPRNPDAARHFCTSAREILTGFLELHAPVGEVLNTFPHCDKTTDGVPTRRTRIGLLLRKQGLSWPESEDFATQNVDNVLELFRVFNAGTHGSAGKLSLAQLKVVKQRVEDSILFLANLVS